MFSKYIHFGKEVWVKTILCGAHKEYCLCWSCVHFKPDNREDNCVIANALYRICVAFDLVTPVWECPNFEEKT